MAIELLTLREQLKAHSDDPEDPQYNTIAYSQENLEIIVSKINEIAIKVNELTGE